MTKKPIKEPKSEKPKATDAQGVPSDKGGATSIPPKSSPADRFAKRVECTREQAWAVYVALPEPMSMAQWSAALEKQGIIAGQHWLWLKVAKGPWKDFPREKAMATASAMKPTDFKPEDIIAALVKSTKNFEPYEALQGVQMAIIGVATMNLTKIDDPNYHKGMAEAYGMWTDQLTQTYQYKKMKGEEVSGPKPAPVPKDEQVVPFTQRKK